MKGNNIMIMIICEWCGFYEGEELIDTRQHDLCPCCGLYRVDMCEIN